MCGVALLQVDQREVDVGPGIVRVDGQHAAKGRDRIPGSALCLRHQTEQIRRLRRVRHRGRRGTRFRLGRVGMASVEQRERQVETRRSQRRIDAQRLAKRSVRGGVVELFQSGDAEVAGAVGALDAIAASADGRRLPRRSGRRLQEGRRQAQEPDGAGARHGARLMGVDWITPVPCLTVTV